jgi:GTPase SAR1 family protein
LEHWCFETQHYCPRCPVILVGTKKELRNNPSFIELNETNLEPISLEEGYSMAEAIKAFAYMECSALTGEGMDELLTAAAKASFWIKRLPLASFGNTQMERNMYCRMVQKQKYVELPIGPTLREQKQIDIQKQKELDVGLSSSEEYDG